MNKPCFLICAIDIVGTDTFSFPMCVEFWEEISPAEKGVFLYIPNKFWEKHPSVLGLEYLSEYVESIENDLSVCVLTDKKFHKIVFDFFMQNKEMLCLGFTPISFFQETKETCRFIIKVNENLLVQKEIKEYVVCVNNQMFLN